MVMACCDYCYEKYINEDGTPDRIMIEKIEKKSKDFIEKYNTEHPERTRPAVFRPVSCNCPCHQKGMHVLH